MNLPPDDQVYVDGYVATQAHFIDGLPRGPSTRRGASTPEDHGRRLGGLPLGRGRPDDNPRVAGPSQPSVNQDTVARSGLRGRCPMFEPPYRAAVIGRTGRGDYGHGLEWPC